MAKIATVFQSAPVSGFSYIRNPRNPSQILQIQSMEGENYLCYPVVSGTKSNVVVDKKNAIYVHQSSEVKKITP